MRSAILISNPSSADGTFGTLLLDDHSIFQTGELPYKNNQNGISCIPASPSEKPYLCKWIDSPKHGWCYQITGVENRDMIEIHSANWMGDMAQGKFSQLLGCVALGKSIGILPDHPNQKALLRSAQAIQEFNSNMNKEDFLLTIIRNKGK